MNRPFPEDLCNILGRIAPLHRELSGKNLFISGGTGFFGKWLLESFIMANRKYELGSTLTILSRSPSQFLSQNPYFRDFQELSFIKGDVRSFDFPSGKYDYVIHAATEANVKLEQENPGEMYSVITEGTRRILEFMRHSSAEKLLFISSGAVYGAQPSTVSHIPETFQTNPVTAYGKGKKISEQLCIDASAGQFKCLIARPFSFIGPYLPLDAHFAIGNFILDGIENRPITIKGDGTPLRSYMYAADLAVWLWTILVNGKNCKAYNVGSDQPISIAKLAEEIKRCFKKENEICILNPSNKADFPSMYVPDLSMAMDELNLKLDFNISQSIEKTIAWHLIKAV